MAERSEHYRSFVETWSRHCGAPAAVFTGQLDVTIAAETARIRARGQAMADAIMGGTRNDELRALAAWERTDDG